MNSTPLSAVQLDAFRRDGLLVVPGFYDARTQLLPIQRAIHHVIGQVMLRHGIRDERAPFDAGNFDDGYAALIAIDRSWGSEVYDAVKQIPAFIRLLADLRHERVFAQLRPGSAPAIAAGGYGIRIDNPAEDRFRAEWHQEYPAQLRSLDGLVFWSPLRAVTEELGPVRFCPGSHSNGPIPVLTQPEPGSERSGAYALRLQDEEQVIGRYAEVAPLTVPGDLVLIDFLTLHASGYNRSMRPRWSMQFRYFNFNEPTGRAHGWKGSFAAGVDFRQIHPELCAD
ncbi:phytanoyl-CoA dioxygenase family protein [Thermomonas aquatica]|uniref:Phytanoyl-CoA dioxygenase family protein n=1 Tax=Thermomonas aquatica TaxID=2202149 RepID=A0A5B7ZP44_9GAMM|nr:phytanoyl-CoA dioxygenase family protein [Thermomonas aquatica]QDA56850.1 phytanoyl-CoA dioxygenase family protein [Thermomonas aquatica]